MDNKLKILLYLAKNRDSFTFHELSKLLSIPYATFYRTTKLMDDLINVQVKGKSKLISINWTEIVLSYLAIASFEEKKEFMQKHQIIRRIEQKAKEITLVFGSYAKGKQNKRSDIDVMIINEKGKKNNDFSDLELLYDVKINPIFFTKEEFVQMLTDKEENVCTQALNNHVLLSGFTEFWRLVVDGVQ